MRRSQAFAASAARTIARRNLSLVCVLSRGAKRKQENPMSSNFVEPQPNRVPALPHNMVTTTLTLDGYSIVHNLGLVHGIIVRSRSTVGTIGATCK